MYKPTLNKTEIELLGNKLLLSERYASDVNNLTEFSKARPEKDIELATYEALVVVRDGLKINQRSLKWWNILKKMRIKRLLNLKYLLKNLSTKQIFDLAEKVYNLEGIDVKKKMTPEAKAESAEAFATHF